MVENKQEMKTAALLIIGDEILSGRTKDKNAGWLAEELTAFGVQMIEVRVVPDIEDEIIGAVHALREKADYLMTTGGIGPTHDDITAESIAKAFETELELNKDAYEILIDHYGDEKLVTEPRKKMAMIPKGADLILNPVSGAPGFHIENVFVMAGVPKIMQGMFDYVKDMMTPGAVILSRSVACNLQESQIAERLGELQKNHPDISIGSYPHFHDGKTGISIVLRSMDEGMLNTCEAELKDIILELGGVIK